jgi:hypothetical protein
MVEETLERFSQMTLAFEEAAHSFFEQRDEAAKASLLPNWMCSTQQPYTQVIANRIDGEDYYEEDYYEMADPVKVEEENMRSGVVPGTLATSTLPKFLPDMATLVKQEQIYKLKQITVDALNSFVNQQGVQEAEVIDLENLMQGFADFTILSNGQQLGDQQPAPLIKDEDDEEIVVYRR